MLIRYSEKNVRDPMFGSLPDDFRFRARASARRTCSSLRTAAWTSVTQAQSQIPGPNPLTTHALACRANLQVQTLKASNLADWNSCRRKVPRFSRVSRSQESATLCNTVKNPHGKMTGIQLRPPLVAPRQTWLSSGSPHYSGRRLRPSCRLSRLDPLGQSLIYRSPKRILHLLRVSILKYTYTQTHIHICTHTHTRTQTHTHIHVHTPAPTHTPMPTPAPVPSHTDPYPHPNPYAYTYMQMYAYTCIHTYIHIYIHTYMYTDTCTHRFTKPFLHKLSSTQTS